MTKQLLNLLAVLLAVASSSAQPTAQPTENVGVAVILPEPNQDVFYQVQEALFDGSRRNLRHDARELCGTWGQQCCTFCQGFKWYECVPQCKNWSPGCCSRRLEEEEEEAGGKKFEVRVLESNVYQQCAEMEDQDSQLIYEQGRFTFQAWEVLQDAHFQCMEIVEVQDSLPWIETFDHQDGDKLDDGSISWTTSCTKGTTSCSSDNNGVFEVKNGELMVNGDETLGLLTTTTIDISGHDRVRVSLDMRSVGDLESGGDLRDYVELYAKVDNGPEDLLDKKYGAKESGMTLSKKINLDDGSSELVVIIKAYVSSDSEYYFLDNLKVEPA